MYLGNNYKIPFIDYNKPPLNENDTYKILEKMYTHPIIKGARVSYRHPNKIILEISERIPFARVNNGIDNMIMLDEHCFVIPNIEEVKNYSVPTLSKFNAEPKLYPIGEIALSVKINGTPPKVVAFFFFKTSQNFFSNKVRSVIMIEAPLIK